MTEDVKYEYLRRATKESKGVMLSWVQRARDTHDAIVDIQGRTDLLIQNSQYQNPPIYMYNEPSDEQLEVARDEAQIWVREMARAARAAGYSLTKFGNDRSFGFKVDDTNLEFTVNTELTCTQVPVLNEDGSVKIETVTRSEYVEVQVDQVVTEKKCITLIAPREGF